MKNSVYFFELVYKTSGSICIFSDQLLPELNSNQSSYISKCSKQLFYGKGMDLILSIFCLKEK